jgi:hypothetical protein
MQTEIIALKATLPEEYDEPEDQAVEDVLC